MADRVIQSSFNVGELSPALFARTDLQKYHSAAALLRNFFVDYRGGASTRPGTRYINQCYKSGSAVRLIPFQASFDVDYILEFGDHYVRFVNNGVPILESSLPVGAANSYAVGDWVYYAGTGTSLDGNYYIVTAAGAKPGLSDLFGVAVANTAVAGNVSRVYTLPSPYASADLAALKFTQDVSTMVICHPSYTPYALTLVTSANWTLTPIVFGTTAATPTNLAVSSSVQGGRVSYSYTVTAVNATGDESGAAAPVSLLGRIDIRSNPGTNRFTWSQALNAVSYNVYKASVTYFGAVPPGVPYGFVGNTTGTTFDDSNIDPDYSQTPPIPQTPFLGGGITSVTPTASGVYTAVPAVTAPNPGGPNSVAATLAAVLVVQDPIGAGGQADSSAGYRVGDYVNFPNGIVLCVAALQTGSGTQAGAIAAYQPTTYPGCSPGSVTSGNVPSNPLYSTGTNSVNGNGGAAIRVTWGVGGITVITPGSGYPAPPPIQFNPAGAAATATINTRPTSYPTVAAFFQQRLFLGGGNFTPSTFFLSRPGNHYNFNVSNPTQADDAITGTLVEGQLNTIKSAVATSAGLIIFTDKANWLINGGSAGAAVSPASIVANPQSHNGASDVPPIVSNYDILYVQSKGSIVRDSTYNLYANVYTGSDISALSSHLFYGYQILEWAFAEEPFKLIWAVRSDGQLLTLTFLKEQEFTAWTHSDTTGGKFESVATVVEPVGSNEVDAVYFVVNRTVNGQTVRYIERLAERQYATRSDAWCVDAGIQYSGAPKATFTGAAFLSGLTVTGLADGQAIPPFVMPANGTFTLASPASKVVVGLGFTAQLQTLPLDTGEPTIQGKETKISAVTLRVAQTLGLKMGTAFNTLVLMKDTLLGNVGRGTDAVASDLVTADVYTILDPDYTVRGQYCIQADQPYPATILGVIPEFTVEGRK